VKRVRVLVVDDSATMRRLIESVLSREPDIDVVGMASDAAEAREAIKRLAPDVVTLDVEMPQMDGIEFLEKLMRLRPTPVIMVSSHTDSSTDLALQALALGAIDCVGKPRPGDPELFADLAPKIRVASKARCVRPTRRPAEAAAATRPATQNNCVVAIGSSTGGIEALSAVLERFPADGPPVVITQHMPENFTKSLAARLNRLCDATVEEARDGAPLQPGMIYVAPGGPTHLQVAGSGTLHCRLRPAPPVSGHRPSVDVLFQSVSKAAGGRAVGVILSGMGRDGAEGLLAMRRSGARTLGQDEATCMVYGMPRSAFEIGAVERQLPIDRIRDAILTTTAHITG
jgi:two-component system chemotaxis response regulator CheB